MEDKFKFKNEQENSERVSVILKKKPAVIRHDHYLKDI